MNLALLKLPIQKPPGICHKQPLAVWLVVFVHVTGVLAFLVFADGVTNVLDDLGGVRMGENMLGWGLFAQLHYRLLLNFLQTHIHSILPGTLGGI